MSVTLGILMGAVAELIERVNHLIWSSGIPIGDQTVPFIVIALLGTGLFLTLRLRFVQVRHLPHAVGVASGKWDDPADPGDVTHFQALSTALSATVGIGNIAGVAIAIHFGGPGALFWMWVTALLGMATKFAEVTLAQKYRIVLPQLGAASRETVSGGPMYYIERGLGAAWKPLAVVFAVALGLSAFLTGNGVQANTLADSLKASFDVAAWLSGGISAALVGGVILGGIRRIGRVTSILAPSMAALYVGAALVVVALNAGQIVDALALIFVEAFQPSAGIAGTGVGSLLVTMMWGVKRGLFSNEAGQGSAPIAHAAARTDEPVSEGVVALLEPLIDTIVICTMTALVIIMTGAHEARIPTRLDGPASDLAWANGDPPEQLRVESGRLQHEVQLLWHGVAVESVFRDEAMTQPFTGVFEVGARRAIDSHGVPTPIYGAAVENGAPLTMLAFERGLAPLFAGGQYIVVLCVALFAVSTAISWSYYGDRCAQYVLGGAAVVPYRVVFVLMHFVGAIVPLRVAWMLGDLFMGIVILPNLLALLLLSPEVAESLRSYFKRKPWLDPQ